MEQLTKMMAVLMDEAQENRKSQDETMMRLVEKMMEKKKEKENEDATTLKAFSDLPELDGKPDFFVSCSRHRGPVMVQQPARV